MRISPPSHHPGKTVLNTVFEWQIWRLRDAISDKGIHAYLEHHWAVLELVPYCDASNDGYKRQAAASPGAGHLSQNVGEILSSLRHAKTDTEILFVMAGDELQQ